MLSGDEGARRLRREHGFQLPLHPLQVSGWLALIVLSAGAFLLLIPPLPYYLQCTSLYSLSTLLLFHIAANFSASLLDPVEPALRKISPTPVPDLDRSKYVHVIENGFCHLCGIHISGPRTKHCSACNKCVALFDHHCKWLNHCVGARNYAPFLMCVSTAVIAAILVALLAFAELIIHHIDPNWLSRTPTNESVVEQTLLLAPVNDVAFLIVVAVLGILAAITAGLLLHLCFFHIYISFLGLTTFEYIRQQRQPPVQNTPDNACVSLNHRPINLNCESRTTHQITALFTCAVLEEPCRGCAEPTPTPPTTPEDCHTCILKNTNAIALESNKMQHVTHRNKLKHSWNCCTAVPDSPDDPQSPTEPRCLINLCKYKTRIKINTPASPRTHGHWSSAKIRVLFRVIGSLGQHRRRNQVSSTRSNQVSPGVNNQNLTQPITQTVTNLIPVPTIPTSGILKTDRLPTLPPPPRRRMVSENELADALSILQHQQHQQQQRFRRRLPQYRRRIRSTGHRPKTPTLSPIRESGLSNPASPSRQICTIATMPGSCTRPF